MRVKFVKDAVKQAGNRVTGVADPGARTERYREGQEVDFADLMGLGEAETPEARQRVRDRARLEGQRWVNRGLAVNLDEAEAAERQVRGRHRDEDAPPRPARPATHVQHPAPHASGDKDAGKDSGKDSGKK